MAAINGNDTRALLVKAHELSKTPESIEARLEWASFLEKLTLDKCPKTYLVVVCILLTARAMHSKDVLNVLEIKRGGDPLGKGYSAPSIGLPLAAFVKEHKIDLRATSQQPMNNQPFTYKEIITEEMAVRPNLKAHWDSFFKVAEHVNDLSSHAALHFLAYIFANRKLVAGTAKEYLVGQIDWEALGSVTLKIANFVDSKSDSGKVGQAFASSLLDLLYSEDYVEQGNSQDPDASIPGDVHVRGLNNEIWLWVEVKQQPIQTGQIIGFIDKVAKNRGQRILYLALKNGEYPSEISMKKVDQQAARKDLRLTVFQSPEEAIDWFLEYAPGSYAEIVAVLLSRIHARLVESGCSEGTLADFETLASEVAALP